ncbi:MAG: transcription elongation factor GreB [Burkholderiaceae bacterium]|nr:transcription elongation factor GreB [Burkholderiaceae bacterium]
MPDLDSSSKADAAIAIVLYNTRMNKAFVRETEGDDGEEFALPALPAGMKNYITPAGHQRLKDELLHLIDTERPEVVRVVSWAASNGDRSENGDYIYGKRRLREIDRRIRFLIKRLDAAEVFDPSVHHGSDQIFFGATVTYERESGEVQTVTIVGIDEFDPLNGKISWISPMARALTKAREGEAVMLKTPAAVEELQILEVCYPSPSSAAG